MKRLIRGAVLSAVLTSLAGAQASAGVFGVGNTSDLAMQLQFAKTNAITFVQTIDPESFAEFVNDSRISDFYRTCRETMFLGLLKTEFRIVKSIPDGGEFHAVMRRGNGYIEVSRTMMEQLAKAGLFTAQGLTAQVIHEVGHDCQINGVMTDDSYDPLLDKLAELITQAASAKALSHFRAVDFIAKVQEGKAVDFVEVPSAIRAEVSARYLDYVADWVYLRHRDVLKDLIPERPAVGTRFEASGRDSWFPGWGTLDIKDSRLKTLVRELIEASYRTSNISYYDGRREQPLPTRMACKQESFLGVSGTSCSLQVSWAPLSDTALRKNGVILSFRMNVLGQAIVDNIRMIGR